MIPAARNLSTDRPLLAGLLLAATVAGVGLLGACAGPNTRKDDPVMRTWEQNQFHELFKLVDVNNDGKVTPEEFQMHYVAVTWLYFDKNGDGVITAAEWATNGTSRQRVEWFQDLDANGDGVLTRKEFDAAMTPEGTKKYFELMDVDGNGFLTVEDLQRS